MEVAIKVPTSQKEITVEQFQRYKALKVDAKNETFIREKLIEIFCGVPHLLVHKMRRRDFMAISGAINLLLEQDHELQTKFKIDGVEYGFIPNLNDITVGEYADLDNYLENWDDLHKAMAVLYRRVVSTKGENYIIVDYEGTRETAEVMKKMPLSVARGAIVFFYRLSSQLLTITPKYLQRKLQEAKTSNQMEVVKLLEKNGVGINTYTHLLEAASLKLEMLLKLNWGKHSFSLPSQKTITTP